MQLVLVVVAGLLIIGYIDKFQKQYPTSKLQLSGKLEYLSVSQLENQILDLLATNLWLINVNTIKDRLYQDPWVQFVFVSKNWPDILQVEVVNHNPIAIWNEQSFLAASGKILPFSEHINSVGYHARLSSLKLPKLYGVAGQEQWVIENYYMLLEKLATIGLYIAEITATNHQGIEVLLTNNVKLVLGSYDLPGRMNRFILGYKRKLRPIISDIAYIDLRYNNGIAVSWLSKDSR